MLSGADCTLAFSGQGFSFSHEDLARRALVAAAELGLAGPAADREPGAARDFSALVLTGRLASPESPAGDAAMTFATDSIVGGVPELVYWLRKLVFRTAWVDARVTDGRIQVRYDERRGTFSYTAEGLDLAPTRRDDLPGWAGRAAEGRTSA